MSPHSNEQNDNWVGNLLGSLVNWTLLIVFGAWLVGKWLTELLFVYVLNPMWNGVFDRHDGLVVVTATGVWIVIGWICFPLVVSSQMPDASTTELWPAFGSWTLFCSAWGASIGGALVLTWWLRAEAQPRQSDFTEVVELPGSFYQTPPSSQNGRLTDEADIDELEGLILGVEWAEANA